MTYFNNYSVRSDGMYYMDWTTTTFESTPAHEHTRVIDSDGNLRCRTCGQRTEVATVPLAG